MFSDADSPWRVLAPNGHLIVIAVFGGFVLFGLKFAEHFCRRDEDKLPIQRYIVFFIGLLVALPVLGGCVTCVYLMNGDRLSPILALQVGLTSPAILQSLIIAAADTIARNAAPRAMSGR